MWPGGPVGGRGWRAPNEKGEFRQKWFPRLAGFGSNRACGSAGVLSRSRGGWV
jgi:hypothetical protein